MYYFIQITANSNENLENSVYNIIAFLYFPIYVIDECGFSTTHVIITFLCVFILSLKFKSETARISTLNMFVYVV